MIASTAPRSNNTAIKAPTISSAPPLQFLQGGGQISDYRFTSGPYAGMTVSEVRNLVSNFSGQVQNNFGPKQPKPITGSNSTDQAAGLIAGIGAPIAATAGYNYLAGAGTAAASTGASAGAGTAGASTLGNLSLSQALGLGGSGTATTAGTAGATTAGAGTAGAGTAATGATGAGIGASLLPAAGIAAGAATGYLQGKGVYDAARGEDLDLASQAALALPTFGTSFLYNPVKNFFGSKKKGERIARKQGRLGLQNAGLMNADSRSRYNLASGNQFDISEFKKNTGKDAYNVDWSGENANRGDQVGLTNALANALIGSKGGVASAMSGELYNAYNSDGNFDANVKAAYDKVGGRNAVYQAVAEKWKKAKESGKDTYTAAQRDADFASIDRLYGIKNTSNARWEDSQNLSEKDKNRNAQELANAAQPTPKAPAQATNKPLFQENVATNKPLFVRKPATDGGAMLKNKKKK